MKISAQIMLSPEAEKQHKNLIKQAIIYKKERMILVAFNKKIELIKENPKYGNPIAKKLIPQEYKTRYSVTNLFRVELPNFWRMLYTLVDGETKIEIISFVLDIINHKKYNKKFGYKKK
ncbi:hypothetical protein KY315_01780 [Candidatus Woesearchaeota archaeon]|nr:hypothetical protein [Candidatus Woesearchaeota archaeon]